MTRLALLHVPWGAIQVILSASFYASCKSQLQDDQESSTFHHSHVHALQSTWPADVCGDWHTQQAAFHAQMRAASRNSGRGTVTDQGSPPQDTEPRFATFSCAKLTRCGGVGDVLLGVFSAFLVAVLQGRALIINHPLVSATFDPAFADWRMTEDINVDQPNTADEFEGKGHSWRVSSKECMNLRSKGAKEIVIASISQCSLRYSATCAEHSLF